MTERILIGSRDSRMALVQAERVRAAILTARPGADCRLVAIPSEGDLDQQRRLDDGQAQGLFTDRLRDALLAGDVDLCVHSLKDLPYGTDTDCPVTAYLRRDDPREALALPFSKREQETGASSETETIAEPIGCSCGRRRLQIRRIFPGIETRDVRGVVPHRIEQMERGDFGGLLLAVAGLERLGLGHYAARIYSTQELVPAAGQGVIALQGRRGEPYEFYDSLNDPAASKTAAAERLLEEILIQNGVAVAAAYAEISGSEMHLTGLIGEERSGAIRKRELSGSADSGEALAEKLAGILLRTGREQGLV
jgi:hydroxymethylbilane synthase